MQSKLGAFLTKYGMHHDGIDMNKCLADFVKEMEQGLAGKDGSSLMMLPTYLNAGGKIPTNEPITVIDAGGTNFRVATITFNDSLEPTIEGFQVHPMPGTQGTLSKEVFFDTIAEYIMPLVNNSEKIGFCFSYPTEILPNKDGRFIKFSKEVSVTGMEGAVIGEEINKSLAKRGLPPKRFILLNDTVSAMLGGTTADPDRQADSYIGFILGTGTNTCYIESGKNITKSPEAVAMGGNMAVNVESGGYALFPRGDIDIAADNLTNTPGSYQYEKMVAGAYQGGVVYQTIKQAVTDGLFSQSFADAFGQMETVTMPQIDQFCDNPSGENPLALAAKSCKDDQELLLGILQASYERAAKLVAVNLGAIMVKTGTGKNPDRPVYIAVEGTTFHKSKTFRAKLDIYVKSFLNEELGVYPKFVKVENGSLLGTAIAGLLN